MLPAQQPHMKLVAVVKKVERLAAREPGVFLWTCQKPNQSSNWNDIHQLDRNGTQNE